MSQGSTSPCGLPGCETPVEQLTGEPPRKYCRPAHRTEARKARLAVRVASDALTVPFAQVPHAEVSYPEARYAEAGTWSSAAGGVAVLVKPRSWERMLVEQQFAPAAGLDLHHRPEADPSYEGRYGVAVLPSPSESVWAKRLVQDLDPTCPDLQRIVESQRGRTARHTRRTDQRRRRMLAALSAAGIVAGASVGGWLTERGTETYQAAPHNSTRPGIVTDGDWVNRAKVTLSSLDGQLARIANAQRAWEQLPASRRQGDPPSEVREMLRRKSELEQQRSAVVSALSSQAAAGGGAPVPLPDAGDRTTTVTDPVLNLVRHTPVGKAARKKAVRSGARRSEGVTSSLANVTRPLGRVTDGLGLGGSSHGATRRHRHTEALDDLAGDPTRIAEWAKREVASIERALDVSRGHSSRRHRADLDQLRGAAAFADFL